MDRTVEIAEAFAEMQATATPEAMEAEHATGVAAAKAAMAAKEAFFVMDENNLNKLQNAFAIGWNLTWFAANASNA